MLSIGRSIGIFIVKVNPSVSVGAGVDFDVAVVIVDDAVAEVEDVHAFILLVSFNNSIWLPPKSSACDGWQVNTIV